MKHLGDITKINGAEIEPVWCITGGSPCQDLSVAGKRAGLAGARSGLFMEQVRIVKEMREHDRQNGRTGDMVRPRYLVWENVPGAFSSNFKDGFGDFGAVLEEIVRIAEPAFSLPRLQGKWKWTKCGAIDGDGWSVAWRTHDAQYWGVPQRRRRISVVADFGGSSAGEILFEREGVSGHLEQGEPQRQETAGYLEDGAGVHDCVAIEGNGQRESHKGDGWKLTDKMYTLHTTEVHGVAYGIDQQGGKGMAGYGVNVCPTIASDSHGTPHGVAYALDCRNAVANAELSATLQSKPNGGFSYNCVNPVAYTMQAIGEYKDCDVASSCKQRDYKDATDLVVEKKCYGICSYASNSMMPDNPNSGIYEADTSRTLDLNGGNPACNQGGVAVCEKPLRWIVRRLTPLECTRLQGYPDGWVEIGEWTDSKGKVHKDADSPKYKAIGNSIALPFWYWMLKRMAKHLPEDATLGSLFDGISGFCFCWARIHGPHTCRWASEIDEFPIAVVKRHFGDEDTGEEGDIWKYLQM